MSKGKGKDGDTDSLFDSDESTTYLTKRGREGIEGKYNNTVPLTPRLVNCTHNEVHGAYKKWLYLEPRDYECIDITLAATLDREIPGDPLWLYVIAPSGGMKTELLRSLTGYEKVFSLSALTTKTFISGKWIKDIRTGKRVLAGILAQLDGRVLVFKDFTVVLGMRDKERYEIFAQFRDIYDGYHEKAFGTLNFKVSIKATLGCILGVTPIIDKHQKCHTTMGERFLKVRSHPDPIKTTEQALKNMGKENDMRAELRGVVGSFLSDLSFESLPKIPKAQSQKIMKMARYISLMRAWVHASIWAGKVVNMDLPEPEVPTRVVKQLGKLALGLALVRGHKKVMEEDIDTLRRIARDTALPMRQRLVDTMVEDEKDWGKTLGSGRLAAGFFNYASVSNSSKIHYNSVRIEINKMAALGILDTKTLIQPDNTVIIESFEFHKDFRELIDAVQYKTKEGIE